MRELAHRLVLILAVLAFAAGMPLALAVPPALAAEPCPHEHHAVTAGHEHHHPAPAKPQHRHDAAGCLCCCAGTCLSAPDLARTAVVSAPFTAVAVIYPETPRALAGRTLRPDPAPPRTGTQS